MDYYNSVRECPGCKKPVFFYSYGKECMNSFCKLNYKVRRVYGTFGDYKEVISHGNMILQFESNFNKTYFYAGKENSQRSKYPVFTVGGNILFDPNLDEIIQNYNIIN